MNDAVRDHWRAKLGGLVAPSLSFNEGRVKTSFAKRFEELFSITHADGRGPNEVEFCLKPREFELKDAYSRLTREQLAKKEFMEMVASRAHDYLSRKLEGNYSVERELSSARGKCRILLRVTRR